MFDFLQKNAEWMSAIALTFFAGMQWWISHQQVIQELRLKRLELAQQLDKLGAAFNGTPEAALSLMQFMAENQSSFKFLLNKKTYKYEEVLFNYLMKIRQNLIVDVQQKLEYTVQCNEYLNDLTDALCNAKHGMVKFKPSKNNLKPYKDIVKNIDQLKGDEDENHRS